MVRSTAALLLVLAGCAQPHGVGSGLNAGITRANESETFSTPTLVHTVALIAIGDVGKDGGRWLPRMFCSGTLISKDLVLTAAHCFSEAKKLMPKDHRLLPFVYFHDFDQISDTSKYNKFMGTKFQVHAKAGVMTSPSFSGVMKNDLALIKLDTAPTDGVPMKLRSGVIGTSDVVQIAGFGAATVGTKFPGAHLQTLTTKLSTLTAQLPPEATEAVFANGDLSGIDTGDSGGPAFVVENGVNLLVGACSSEGESAGVKYSFFENLPTETEWLHKAAKALGGDTNF